MAEEKVELFNKNDGVLGRDGGPYADEVMGEIEEQIRARREGRKPTVAGAKLPHPGIQLVNAAQLIEGYNPTTLAGDDRQKFDGTVTAPVYAKVAQEEAVGETIVRNTQTNDTVDADQGESIKVADKAARDDKPVVPSRDRSAKATASGGKATGTENDANQPANNDGRKGDAEKPSGQDELDLNV